MRGLAAVVLFVSVLAAPQVATAQDEHDNRGGVFVKVSGKGPTDCGGYGTGEEQLFHTASYSAPRHLDDAKVSVSWHYERLCTISDGFDTCETRQIENGSGSVDGTITFHRNGGLINGAALDDTKVTTEVTRTGALYGQSCASHEEDTGGLRLGGFQMRFDPSKQNPASPYVKGAGAVDHVSGVNSTGNFRTSGIFDFSPAPPTDEGWRDALCGEDMNLLASDFDTADALNDVVNVIDEAGNALKPVGKVLGPVGIVFGVGDLACTLTEDHTGSSKVAQYACVHLASTGVGLGVAAVFATPTLVGAAILGTAGLMSGVASTFACAVDPPDPNYDRIAHPNPPDFKLSAGLPRRVDEALTGFGRNLVRVQATGGALMHCINRAAGARLAGDAVWERRQRECASSYAAKLARLMIAGKELRHGLVRALRSEDIPNPRITKATLQDHARQIRRKTRGTLKRWDVTDAEIEFVEKQLPETLDFVKRQLPGRAFSFIDGKDAMTALDRAAKGFRQISDDYK